MPRLTLAHLHDRADVFARREHGGPDHRLEDLFDLPIRRASPGGHRGTPGAPGSRRPGTPRVITWIGDGQFLPAVEHHAVYDVRRCRDQFEAELALEPLPDDLHVKQPEEAAAEAEPERGGGFRLVDKRGVVQRQLVERVTQFGVVVAVERIEPGEDHRFRVGVAGQRLRCGMARDGHRIAHPCLPDVLHASDQVTDLASAERSTRLRLRRDHADLKRLVRRTRCHHQAALTGGQATIDHADVGDDAPVGVVDRVEDQRPRRGLRVTGGRRDVLHDGVQEFGHTLARLGRDPEHFRWVAADDPCNSPA